MIIRLILLIPLILVPRFAFALDEVTLQLRWLHQAQFAGYYVAEAKGFYHDEGIDITILAGNGNTSPLHQLLNGQDIQTIHDLKDKRIMMFSGTADLVDIGHMTPQRWQHIANQLTQLNIIPPTQIDEPFLFSQRKDNLCSPLNTWQQGGIALLLIVSLLAGYLYHTNRRLKHQVEQHKLAEQQAMHMARIDTLTGIANRYALLKEIHLTVIQMRPNQSLPALLFIDLDNFKAVNDTYGHQAGDKVLQQFCNRVNSVLTQTDSFFARLAGDEFVVLLKTTSESTAEALAAMIIQQATKPFIIGELTICIGASVGTTFYRNGDTPDYFLSRADSKMYHNKKRSRQERFINQNQTI
ncbi:diguanylate cyclase domain-containing protein [Photobacterium nomapromontoriensis]|uniref:ABC transporter substrate-binding protein n=1 Tax=Photobacterium nomapromontoriensis TaxID=2910237 RepID=UPI003D1107AF